MLVIEPFKSTTFRDLWNSNNYGFSVELRKFGFPEPVTLWSHKQDIECVLTYSGLLLAQEVDPFPRDKNQNPPNQGFVLPAFARCAKILAHNIFSAVLFWVSCVDFKVCNTAVINN